MSDEQEQPTLLEAINKPLEDFYKWLEERRQEKWQEFVNDEGE
jgi:hypothetical protein